MADSIAPGSRVAVVICAAGSSKRMGGKKKEYCILKSERPLTVLGAAVRAFASCPRIDPIVITVPQGETNVEAASCLPPELCKQKFTEKQRSVFFVPGGQSRRASVYNALSFLKPYNPSYVLIHDGARPWISANLIEEVINAVIKHGAVIPALPLTETPKELECNELVSSGLGFIKRHLRRETLCAAQTPQGFAFAEILTAHEKARDKEEAARQAGSGFEYTDDAEVWGEFVGQVAVIPGDPVNRKITFPGDLEPASLEGERA